MSKRRKTDPQADIFGSRPKPSSAGSGGSRNSDEARTARTQVEREATKFGHDQENPHGRRRANSKKRKEEKRARQHHGSLFGTGSQEEAAAGGFNVFEHFCSKVEDLEDKLGRGDILMPEWESRVRGLIREHNEQIPGSYQEISWFGQVDREGTYAFVVLGDLRFFAHGAYLRSTTKSLAGRVVRQDEPQPHDEKWGRDLPKVQKLDGFTAARNHFAQRQKDIAAIEEAELDATNLRRVSKEDVRIAALAGVDVSECESVVEAAKLALPHSVGFTRIREEEESVSPGEDRERATFRVQNDERGREDRWAPDGSNRNRTPKHLR